MNAAFYTQHPRSTASYVVIARGRRARRLHRSVATVFALTVTANFVTMPWGPPRAWITYAPLPPLLILLVTVMLAPPWIAAVLRARHGEDE